jgi:flagellar hook-length control protein FliK
MSVMNTDLSSRLAAIEPTYADYATNQTANSQNTFGNYLQMAQAQPAQTAPSNGSWSSSGSSDSTGPSASSSANLSPQADINTALEQSGSRLDNRSFPSNNHDLSGRQQNAAPATASQEDSVSSTTAGQNESTTSQDHVNDGSQGSGSGSSSAGASHSADGVREDDTHKVKSDATAVIADVNLLATAAASAAATSGNPLDGAQARAAATGADAKSANALNTSAAVHPSQTTAANAASGQTNANQPAARKAVDGQAIASQATAPQPTADGQAAADQAAAQQAAAATASADTAFPAPKEKPAAPVAAASADPSTAAKPAKPDDKTADINLTVAAVAATPASPAATTTPAVEAKPQSAAAGGVTPAIAAQSTDTTSTQVTSEAAAIPDAQLEESPRGKFAVESLSPSGNDTAATANKPENSSSSSAAAIPQTAAHNASAAGGDSTASQTADTNLSQADRVRFVQRVEQAFQDLSDQGGSVRLRLSPPELGSLRLEINISNGEMTARVQAETPAARNVLLDNLPALRERLAQHDIKVQRFDVDLMDRSGGGTSNQSSQYQNPSGQNAGGAFVRTPFRGSSEQAAAAEVAVSRPVNGGGQLNVVV